ncbi:MAG: DUF58 domain-containing protein [Candidatus Brocadiales bacterium]|nr:DUF58 domain-containing protein [Candidatus Brocadiales bacterium]
MKEPETTYKFDPVTLSKISNLTLRARSVVEGTLTGIHKSPHKGASIEFLEHKEYSPGDEIKHIDWKVLGRSDKYYLKQFEEETNLRAYILLDTSGSMGYGSGAMSKLEYSATLAACLCYLLLMQSDAVGLVLFGKDLIKYIPPRSKGSHLQALLQVLEGLKAQGTSNLPGVLNEFAEKEPRRSLIIILSDFFDNIPEVLKSLRQFKQRKNEIVLFHVLDSYELEFPFDKLTLFESMEDSNQVLAEPSTIRDSYMAELSRFMEELRQGCLEEQIDHWLINTSTPLDRALLKYLSTRDRLSHSRFSTRR